VAQAQGDAQRFKSVLTEYQKAPQVTRDRMYLDAMQQIYSNVTKVMIDSRQGSNLLYMPLDKIMQGPGQVAPPTPSPRPQQMIGCRRAVRATGAAAGCGCADARARDGTYAPVTVKPARNIP
jgi:membrane protease subunit HflK